MEKIRDGHWDAARDAGLKKSIVTKHIYSDIPTYENGIVQKKSKNSHLLVSHMLVSHMLVSYMLVFHKLEK